MCGGIAFFVLLVFVWLAECMGTLSRFVMGYLSQEWFFSTYDSTQNHKLIPTWNIAEAYRMRATKHVSHVLLLMSVNCYDMT